ncbi:MAG: (Fe-S)-binding protein [Planctomycetaceae bacterium]
MSNTENVLFAILFTALMLLFLYSAFRLVRLIRMGQPDIRLQGQWGKRFLTMLLYAFGQRRVISKPFGFNHFFLFWGFMILFLSNAEFSLNGLFPSFSFRFLGAPLYGALTGAFDLVSLLVLVCVGIALFRRLVLQPTYIEAKSGDAFLILGLVAGLVIAYYGVHGCEFALQSAPGASFMPVSQKIAAPLVLSLFGGSLPLAERVFWWVHAFLLLGFLNYLPYSKHLHILAAIPDCFCRSFETSSLVSRETFSRGESYGVSRVNGFTWKDLLDFTACTECGRCNDNCPATLSGKTLNPRYVIRDGKVNLKANGEKILQGNVTQGLMPLIRETDESPGSVGEDALWACTTCRACMANCPVFIEHVPKIVKMRRHLTENQAKFPEELRNFYESIEQRSNPWGIIPQDRIKWAKGLDIPLVGADESLEYLFYVGCAGSFDSRNRKAVIALVQALRAAGVSFGMLGAEEKCCGDSLRRLGNEFIFEKLAVENVELFKKYKVKKILTYCPHCYSTLKHDYRQYGLEATVFHHSEFLYNLLEAGKLRLKGPDSLGRVVIHDSCYLGRYNQIYGQPREILRMATGQNPVEMDRNLEKSFCCGAGGGRMWMEESAEHRLNINRTRQALAKTPDTIAVSCPYCMTMFEDGLKNEKADQVRVLDLAEIVAPQIAPAKNP